MQEGPQAKFHRLYQDPDVIWSYVPDEFIAASTPAHGLKPAGTPSIVGTASTVTASRGPAMGRRRRFCIPRRAIIARGSSSSRRPPTGPARIATISAGRSRHGLHGTSMPAFHSLMTESEIEQVIDYVMFLSMRGETELAA